MSFTGRDREVYDRSKEITIDLINELHSRGFLKMHVTSEEDALLDKIIKRVTLGVITVDKLESTITNEKWPSFRDMMKEFGFTEEYLFHMYGMMLVHGILDTFELLKKYLMVTLDKEQLRLNGREPLGTLINKFEQNHVPHRLDDFMNRDIRNAIGHGWYWFSSNDFHYTVDPELKRTRTLSLGELFVQKREVSLLTKAFIDNAFERILELRNNPP